MLTLMTGEREAGGGCKVYEWVLERSRELMLAFVGMEGRDVDICSGIVRASY